MVLRQLLMIGVLLVGGVGVVLLQSLPDQVDLWFL